MNTESNTPEDNSSGETPPAGGRFALILATGLGVGYCPAMPGTVGSLWGLALVWLLLWLEVSLIPYLAIAVLLFLVGIPICSLASRQLNKSDPGSIVWDEIAAFPLTFLPLVLLDVPLDVVNAIAGFAWFRLFDIWKPWPIRKLDELHGGVGVMSDDQAAAVFAALGLWGTVWVLG